MLAEDMLKTAAKTKTSGKTATGRKRKPAPSKRREGACEETGRRAAQAGGEEELRRAAPSRPAD